MLGMPKLAPEPAIDGGSTASRTAVAAPIDHPRRQRSASRPYDSSNFLNAAHVLWPPNPKALLSAMLTSRYTGLPSA